MIVSALSQRIAYKLKDLRYSNDLKRIRDTNAHPLITVQDINELKPIYKSAYPESEHGFDEVVNSLGSLLRYLDCHSIWQIYLYRGSDWYVLLIDRFD